MTRASVTITAFLGAVCALGIQAQVTQAESASLRFGTVSSNSRRVSLIGSSKEIGGTGLRRLQQDALDPRPKITRKLIAAAHDKSAMGEPKRRMAIVRALALHDLELPEDSPLRQRLIRALALHFEGAHDDAAEADEDAGLLRSWIRGTAAMALARSAHPEALRLLLASALSANSDPHGAHLAATALRRFVNEPRAAQVSPLFSKGQLESVLRPEPPFPLTEQPKDLIQLPKYAPTAGNENEPSLPQMLRRLRATSELPKSLGSPDAWRDAYSTSPTWTLRALAVLEPRLTAKTRRVAEQFIRDSKKSKKPSEAHAAVWLSSVLGSGSQEGELAIAVGYQSRGSQAIEFTRKLLAGDLEELPLGVRFMPLHESGTWAMLSTARLRALQAQHRHSTLIAALSSRMRTADSGLGPDVATVGTWLTGDESVAVRAAAAHGLAKNRSEAAGPLLLHAYKKEPVARVRRAIVSAMIDRGVALDPVTEQLLRLDPDEGCAARGRGNPDPNATGLYWGRTERRTQTILDREGRELALAPAPDGFVGLTSPHL